jgi:SAM-dependent methyltransferase
MLICDACCCSFYEKPADLEGEGAHYESDEMLTRGRASLYIQQGAGLSQLLLPLARLPAPAGSHYLDIGCGFGFTLDFARHARGWQASGVDPAQIAALGRERLGVTIEPRHFANGGSGAAALRDVVMAAETIEHVWDPVAFLKEIRGVLKPGGILVLTTPDAREIDPGTPLGLLATILSPELHTILQSAESLYMILGLAGFEYRSVERAGSSLVAFASDAAFLLAEDHDSCRATLRHYLETRAASLKTDPDLFFGLAGRGLLECANSCDLVRGARLRGVVAELMLTRFGLDLERMNRLPPELSVCGLERMAELIPLNLGSILYATAMLDILSGTPRAGLRARLALAAHVSRELRRAVGELAMDDALSEDLAWVADSEALLCAAESGSGDVPALLSRLVSLSPPNMDERCDMTAVRCFVTLVNGGHHGLARKIHYRLPEPSTLKQVQYRDMLYCEGLLQLQSGGHLKDALGRFEAVRKTFDPANPDGLYWPSLRGEVEALRRLDRPDDAASRCREVLLGLGDRAKSMPPDLATFARIG